MKKTFLFALFATLALSGCKKDDEPRLPLTEGLTLQNFPVMDGSTSTKPLIDLTAAKLLGYKAGWELSDGVLTWDMRTDLPADFQQKKLLCTQTHGSILNLIDGGTDMIFVARTLSADEKAYAEQKGVTLVEKTIALDALVFMVCNGSTAENTVGYVNPVNSLTHSQIEDIYTARTKNWDELGGDDLPIVPFVRNTNSGSQELMVRDRFRVKAIAVNGIKPDKTTIGNRTYPFTAEVYLMIRDDLDKGSMAYKVYEAMLSSIGRNIVDASGYVPVN